MSGKQRFAKWYGEEWGDSPLPERGRDGKKAHEECSFGWQERDGGGSCSNIILEFRRMFPNIELNIFVEQRDA